MSVAVINTSRDLHYDLRERRRMRNSKRRADEVRRQRQKLMIFAATFIVILFCGIGFGSVHSYATQENNIEHVKCYKSVQIKPGDTLDSYADEYMSIEFKTRTNYIEEVKFINHLSDDTIHAGAHIIVPYYK